MTIRARVKIYAYKLKEKRKITHEQNGDAKVIHQNKIVLLLSISDFAGKAVNLTLKLYFKELLVLLNTVLQHIAR